eukprot:5184706-Prymnesium_polylepis.1
MAVRQVMASSERESGRLWRGGRAGVGSDEGEGGRVMATMAAMGRPMAAMAGDSERRAQREER